MKHYPHQTLYRPKEGLVDPKASPLEDAHRSEMREEILKLLQALPERQREILTLRFGLEDGKPLTLKEIAALQGCTPENVRRYETNALHQLRYPHHRNQVAPFVVSPGSSEILEKAAVDLFFVGLPPALERDWQTLLARGERFQYLPHGFTGSLIPSVGNLPLRKATDQMRRVRLGSLGVEDVWFFRELYRKNGLQPLIFDLSADNASEDHALREKKEKGRFFFRRIILDLVQGHITRMIHVLAPSSTDISSLYWKIHDVREHHKPERIFSPWMPEDHRFQKFQDALRGFGVEVTLEEKGPYARWLLFKALPFDPLPETR